MRALCTFAFANIIHVNMHFEDIEIIIFEQEKSTAGMNCSLLFSDFGLSCSCVFKFLFDVLVGKAGEIVTVDDFGPGNERKSHEERKYHF